MIILNLKHEMDRIQRELKRALGDSTHLGLYLQYIENLKEVRTTTEARVKHHALPVSVFPQFKNLEEHPWNEVLATHTQHCRAHALLMVAYPDEPRLVQAMRFIFRTPHPKCGGQSRSPAKVTAARKNAAKARKARKPLYPPCLDFHAHVWQPDGRCWGRKCREKYPDLRRLSPKEAKQKRERFKNERVASTRGAS